MTDTGTDHQPPPAIAALVDRLHQQRLASANSATRARALAEQAARVKVEPVKAEPVQAIGPKSDHMTVAEASAYLNITVDQVRGLAADGSLQWINVGRGEKRPRYRFLKSELDRFIADRTTQEAAQCPSTPRRSTRASTSSTSKSEVIGFTARRAALLAARQKSSKL